LTVKASEKPNMLHFSVSDTGIGMTPEQVAIVFDLFSQADTSTTRHFGGTGLGTTISKQIVELMGGEIWVESIFGEGSTFHFTANFPESTTKDDCLKDDCLYENDGGIASTYISPRLFTILLAEDIEVNATLATFRLEQQGHHIHWVKNGYEAIKAFQETDYDLILMDIHMPELDGIETTRAIRKLESENQCKKRITILALTASVFREDNDKCFEAGMDGFVSKPIEFSKLLFAMETTIPEGIGEIRQKESIKNHAINTFDFSPLDGLIDYDKALKTWGDSLEYVKALNLFAREHQHDANKILTALNDNKLAQRYIHSLKGVSSNLVILEITALTKKIENDFAANKNINCLLSQLQIALENVTIAINQLKSSTTLPTVSSTKIVDENAVINLIKKLLIALNELNPDVVEPILLDLEKYLDETEFTQIRYQIDNFDFEEATKKTHLLVKKLGFCKFL
ncbi:MAG: response regulator, partial [Methylococcaceae bacterium]